jgi:hypothetical protein
MTLEERARKLTFDRDLQREIVALLRTVRRETLEEAARVALTCDGDFERDTDARTVEATRRGVAAAICSLAVKEGEGV